MISRYDYCPDGSAFTQLVVSGLILADDAQFFIQLYVYKVLLQCLLPFLSIHALIITSFSLFSDHAIFITGCSGGLGLELAHAILTAGHEVIASSRHPSKTPDAVNAIEKLDGAWISLDVVAADVDSGMQDEILK